MRMDVSSGFYLPLRGEVDASERSEIASGGGIVHRGPPPTRLRRGKRGVVDLPALGEVRGSAAHSDAAA